MAGSRENLAITDIGGREFHWGERTYVMGIVNVTPDSFSGDGLLGSPRKALEQALAFESEGADLIDVGAESTRPGHAPVSEDEELSRLIPVLELLAVPQPHHQRRPDRLPLAAKGVGDKDVRLPGDLSFAPVLGGEHQVAAFRCLLGDAEGALEKGLHHRPQQQLLVGPVF